MLWVQDRLSRREAGRMLRAALPPGVELFVLTVSRPADVLRAMEEGLACPGLSAVVGEVWGETPALSFTASKRLVLRAEREKVPAFLIRRAARADLSAARSRWQLASLPSRPEDPDPEAPAAATWRAGLFRARWRQPADWVVTHAAPDSAPGALPLFTHEAPFNPAAWPALGRAGGEPDGDRPVRPDAGSGLRPVPGPDPGPDPGTNRAPGAPSPADPPRPLPAAQSNVIYLPGAR
ncbi:hypothetical protein [Pseudoroseicyclus sp. CXY001]|uniref:hypothetical protein n=1 Tax=Pseudoroseicyclus sp. CXY001 TaxID=3242492 RepID=UPI0035713401